MNRHSIDIERNLFLVAGQVIRRNWAPCLATSVLLLAASIGQNYVADPLPFTAMRALILMIVGFSAYRTLVSGGRIAGWRAAATDEGRIPWRYAGVMLMILAPILLLGIGMTAKGGGIAPPTGPDGIAMALLLVICYTVAYVLLGTALPEIAAHGEATLGEAIARGRLHYRRIALAMMFGPWVFRAGTLLVLIIAGVSGLTVDLFNARTGALQTAALLPMLLFTASHVIAEVLTATVLVRAYRRYPVTAGAVLTA